MAKVSFMMFTNYSDCLLGASSSIMLVDDPMASSTDQDSSVVDMQQYRPGKNSSTITLGAIDQKKQNQYILQ